MYVSLTVRHTEVVAHLSNDDSVNDQATLVVFLTYLKLQTKFNVPVL